MEWSAYRADPLSPGESAPLPTNWIGFSVSFKDDGFHFETF